MFVLLDKQMCTWCIWENRSEIYCDKISRIRVRNILFSTYPCCRFNKLLELKKYNNGIQINENKQVIIYHIRFSSP